MARKRYITPGFFKNEHLAECSFQARLLFAGLWTQADRDGRLEYRPKRLRADLFPYDDCDMESLCSELLRFDFIVRYEVCGVTYLQVTNFAIHQSPHKDEKPVGFPPPPSENGADNTEKSVGTTKNGAGTTKKSVGTPLTLTLTSTLTKTKTSTCKPPTEVCTETKQASSSEPTVLAFDCDGSPKVWNLKQSLVERYVENYPSLDVMQQIRSARMWLDSDPARKKTAGGMQRFLTGWLNRSQNSNRGSPSGQSAKHKPGVDIDNVEF